MIESKYMPDHKIALFEGKKIRRLWNGVEEKWYFSVVDVVSVLTGSDNPRKYWNKLAERLRKEGSDGTLRGLRARGFFTLVPSHNVCLVL